MNQAVHNKLVSFIWSIADDCLRDVYVRGKYRDVILPMTVLRDSESVPLKENIHQYFLKEVKPHVEEAWINLDATKIGYEISFNKYTYQHKPLGSLEEVTADILALEAESDGLIREILNLA